MFHICILYYLLSLNFSAVNFFIPGDGDPSPENYTFIFFRSQGNLPLSKSSLEYPGADHRLHVPEPGTLKSRLY